jgi:hypothetical protein
MILYITLDVIALIVISITTNVVVNIQGGIVEMGNSRSSRLNRISIISATDISTART